MIPIWFFIGIALTVTGLLIFGAGHTKCRILRRIPSCFFDACAGLVGCFADRCWIDLLRCVPPKKTSATTR